MGSEFPPLKGVRSRPYNASFMRLAHWKHWGWPFLLALSFYIVLILGSTVQGSPRYVSRIPPLAPPFTFVLYGDTREGQEPWRIYDRDNRRRVIERILELEPAFIVNSGDLVGSGGERVSWSRFDAIYRPVREKGVPYFPALGNHEYHDFSGRALDFYFSRFPDLQRRKWYAFRAGPVQLVVLDSNHKDLADAERSEQAAFFKATLDAAEADPDVKAVILLYHAPAFTNSTVHGPSHWTRVNFVDAAESAKKPQVHVVGHVHSYERFLISGGRQYIVSGGGGAPLMSVETDPARVRIPPAFDGPARRWHNFVEVQTHPSLLEFRVHALLDGGWGVVDRFDIPLK